MAANPLTEAARHENALALASILGVGPGEASNLLNECIVVTCRSDDVVGREFAADIRALLERTLASVSFSGDDNASVEIVIGNSRPQTRAHRAFVGLTTDALIMHRVGIATGACSSIPRILRRLAACYVAAAGTHMVLGTRSFVSMADPFVLRFSDLGLEHDLLGRTVQLDSTYLAGAGAIANGLLWAAEGLDLRGSLAIADDDIVGDGNLNRQILFTPADIGFSKAERLARHAAPLVPGLEISPHSVRLQELEDRSDGPWLRRLIVAVDSRRARRALQREMPREVFDASTTDVREVVIHHNRQPTTGACLSCIYMSDEAEYTREHHIAEQLGVTLEEVLSERISAHSAVRIAARYPGLSSASIRGLAYDTLFKELCAEAALARSDGKRVLAPFAFVSCLAGTLLLLEMVRRLAVGSLVRSDNYWRVSAWHPPLSRRRVTRMREPACEFCGDDLLARTNAHLWT